MSFMLCAPAEKPGVWGTSRGKVNLESTTTTTALAQQLPSFTKNTTICRSGSTAKILCMLKCYFLTISVQWDQIQQHNILCGQWYYKYMYCLPEFVFWWGLKALTVGLNFCCTSVLLLVRLLEVNQFEKLTELLWNYSPWSPQGFTELLLRCIPGGIYKYINHVAKYCSVRK